MAEPAKPGQAATRGTATCRLMRSIAVMTGRVTIGSIHTQIRWNAAEISMGEPTYDIPPLGKPLDRRLDSWKEIAAYLNRDVTTVQRWEKREGMPVHRHVHEKRGSVYALTEELDDWIQSRRSRAGETQADETGDDEIQNASETEDPQGIPSGRGAATAKTARKVRLWF